MRLSAAIVSGFADSWARKGRSVRTTLPQTLTLFPPSLAAVPSSSSTFSTLPLPAPRSAKPSENLRAALFCKTRNEAPQLTQRGSNLLRPPLRTRRCEKRRGARDDVEVLWRRLEVVAVNHQQCGAEDGAERRGDSERGRVGDGHHNGFCDALHLVPVEASADGRGERRGTGGERQCESDVVGRH